MPICGIDPTSLFSLIVPPKLRVGHFCSSFEPAHGAVRKLCLARCARVSLDLSQGLVAGNGHDLVRRRRTLGELRGGRLA